MNLKISKILMMLFVIVGIFGFAKFSYAANDCCLYYKSQSLGDNACYLYAYEKLHIIPGTLQMARTDEDLQLEGGTYQCNSRAIDSLGTYFLVFGSSEKYHLSIEEYDYKALPENFMGSIVLDNTVTTCPVIPNMNIVQEPKEGEKCVLGGVEHGVAKARDFSTTLNNAVFNLYHS